MAESTKEAQGEFAFEKARQELSRIERELCEVQWAHVAASRSVQVLHGLLVAAVHFGIFEVRDGSEHADLVKKYPLMVRFIEVAESAMEPAKRALSAWRQTF